MAVGRLSYEEASRLLPDDLACFSAKTISQHINLHPRYLGKLKTGIKQHLFKYEYLYSQKLDGVMIAYGNVRRCGHGGRIYEELPHLHLRVKVDVILFKPKVGCRLRGIVNKINGNNIGCLVHNSFNASIAKPKNLGMDQWAGSKLTLGDTFTFEVTKVMSQNGVLFMRGQIPQNMNIIP